MIDMPSARTLVENGSIHRITDISKLVIKSFFKRGERNVLTEVLKKRAKKMNCDFGTENLEYILAHRDEIPDKFRKFHLIFPCIVSEDSGGHSYYPWLTWFDSNEWVLVWWGFSGCDSWRRNSRGRFLSVGK